MSDIRKNYEMLWDCASCGTKGLLGLTHRQCPNCGAPQDTSKRYFPPEGQEQEAVNHTFDGADKLCPACNTPNGAKSSFCRNCGSPLDTARAASLVGAIPPPRPAVPSGSRKSCLVTGCIAAIVIAVLLTITAILLSLWKKEATATVGRHQWERVIAVEAYGPQSDSCWCDSLPTGAHDVVRKREQRSTDHIPDGEDCTSVNVDNGDGTFHKEQRCTPRYRDEPVYDTRCYYTIERWSKRRDAKAAGEGTMPAPAWPDARLRGQGRTCVGCERERARDETYTLEMLVNGRPQPCKVDQPLWGGVSDGTKIPVQVTVVGELLDCDSIREAVKKK